ncbi:MAG: hypothetical protein E6R13_04075 [Spirochaetes bacterium]|nr:MAG: hypothetical protein E6R13_04075 [Spirochaetota bacterium]
MQTLEKAIETGVVLANAIELGVAVLKEVAGENVATQFEGEDIYSSSILADTLAAKIQSNLTPRLK